MPFFCIPFPLGVAQGWANDCSFGAKFLNLMPMGESASVPCDIVEMKGVAAQVDRQWKAQRRLSHAKARGRKERLILCAFAPLREAFF
jgi:hypothetical protein